MSILTGTSKGNTDRWHPVAAMVRKNGSIVLIYGIILIIALWASIFSPAFRSAPNMVNILRQSIIIGLFAIGQSVVVLTGGMDFTVAMVARTTALTIATIFLYSHSNSDLIIPLIILGIAIGLILGFISGVLVTYTHANPFVITFGVANILRGIDLAISQNPIRGVPAPYLKIYDAQIGIVPINIIVMALVWLAAWIFTTRTRPGRALFAVGGSERIARLSAIRINWTLVMAYVFSGACAALAGLFLLSRNGVGDPAAAEGMEFQSVVAVALGGISLYGGKGSMIGTLGGVLLIAMLWNVFNFMHVDIYYQQLLLGLVVLIAVAAYKSPRSL
jgi:ribose transport system permease protein